MASVICTLFIYGLWAFRGPNRSAENLHYGFDRSTTTITRTKTGSTVHVTYTVHYKQFYDARPIHHQAPIAIPSNLEATDQTTRQDMSHPYVTTTTAAPIPGLYFIPMSITHGGWPQTQQDSHPSYRSASNTERSQTLQGSPGLEASEPEAKVILQSRDIGAPGNLFASQADADTTSFSRWGVEVLYDLRRRSVPFYKGWCVQNACSPHRQLSSMCNTNKTFSDPFRKQECEWCWPEDQKKDQEINNHCTEVSKRAFDAMFFICGVFLLCTLVIATGLVTRMLRRRQRAGAGRIPHKHATTAPPLQEKNSVVPSHWISQVISTFDGSFKAARANNRVDELAIRTRSLGEAIGLSPWYKVGFAKSGKRSGVCPENPAPSRLRLQKQRTKPLDQKMAIVHEDSHARVPVLPPAPPAIGSRVFSDIENMGQGSLLSGPGTSSSQHDPQGMPRRSSRQSRTVSSGNEQSSSGATHRRDAGAGLYNLQRLTERS
ncbi:MAG: hypothetical protein Q9175_003710 [Cornicularia normoerica]